MGRRRRVPSRSFNLLLLGTAFLAILILSGPARPQEAIPSVIKLNYHASESEFQPGAEMQLLEMLTRARQHYGLQPLVMDPSLRFVARVHSRDMAINGYVGHDSLLGESFLNRLAGVVRGGTYVGENVTIAQTPEQAQTSFVASRLHLKNMLEPAFHRVGIGIATAGPLGLVITEDFSE